MPQIGEAVPEDRRESIEAFAAAIIDGYSSKINVGPMPREGSHTSVETGVEATDVTAGVENVPGIGPAVVVRVELLTAPDDYIDRLSQVRAGPPVSEAEAVYELMADHGIQRPDSTPELGVRIRPADPDGDPDAVESSVELLRDVVIVEGYIPLDDPILTDGGFLVDPATIRVIEFGAVPFAVGMARLLTDLGEEYTIKNNLDTATFDVGVYDDASAGATGDAISDTDDLAQLVSEPSSGNYVRQSAAMSAADLSGNWGTDNDASVTFDMTGTSGAADSWFVETNFTAVDTGDGAGTDHLLCTGALSQEYDLSNLTQLEISAGGVGWTVN